MSKKLRELQHRKAAAAGEKVISLKAAREVLEKSAAESRDLTEAEQAQFSQFKAAADAKSSEIERFQAQIDNEQELIAATAGAQGYAVMSGNGENITVTENVASDPKAGFKSFGEYAQAVRTAARPGNSPDQRLLIGAAAPSSYGNEADGADGGYLVPPQYAKDIFTISLAGDESFLPLTNNIEITGNSMMFPRDETTPWGTDGIRAYWQAEASAATATKPVLGASQLRLHKLMSLAPVTDELMQDSNALSGYLPQKMGDSIRWKTNEAFVRGTGEGQPRGFLNSGALVTVAKESGQAGGSKIVVVQNIANMFSRMLPSSVSRSVWLINSDVFPSLLTMTLGNFPIYTPPSQSIANAPAGLLYGRPIVITQHADTVGTAGDISFVDWMFYRTITKAGGIEMATSMHLYFDAGATAFRTTFRVDGDTSLTKPVAQAKGSNSLSAFITLATR